MMIGATSIGLDIIIKVTLVHDLLDALHLLIGVELHRSELDDALLQSIPSPTSDFNHAISSCHAQPVLTPETATWPISDNFQTWQLCPITMYKAFLACLVRYHGQAIFIGHAVHVFSSHVEDEYHALSIMLCHRLAKEIERSESRCEQLAPRPCPIV